jgi:hypothetical protein
MKENSVFEPVIFKIIITRGTFETNIKSKKYKKKEIIYEHS